MLFKNTFAFLSCNSNYFLYIALMACASLDNFFLFNKLNSTVKCGWLWSVDMKIVAWVGLFSSVLLLSGCVSLF